MNSTKDFDATLLAQNIASVPLITEPFDHIFCGRVFPAAFYPALLANLPTNELFDEIRHADALQPDGKSARLSFELRDDKIATLPAGQKEFWQEMARHLLSSEVECAFKTKFQNALEKRNGGIKLDKIKIRPRAFLFRDIKGYKISIHPDAPAKAITVQFYLPGDNSQEHLGTTFYGPAVNNEVQEVKTLPFLPNTGYAFTVTETSWHAVKKMGDNEKPRNSLMIIYYYETGAPSQGY
jgi:hypothetical protein